MNLEKTISRMLKERQMSSDDLQARMATEQWEAWEEEKIRKQKVSHPVLSALGRAMHTTEERIVFETIIDQEECPEKRKNLDAIMPLLNIIFPKHPPGRNTSIPFT